MFWLTAILLALFSSSAIASIAMSSQTPTTFTLVLPQSVAKALGMPTYTFLKLDVLDQSGQSNDYVGYSLLKEYWTGRTAGHEDQASLDLVVRQFYLLRSSGALSASEFNEWMGDRILGLRQRFYIFRFMMNIARAQAPGVSKDHRLKVSIQQTFRNKRARGIVEFGDYLNQRTLAAHAARRARQARVSAARTIMDSVSAARWEPAFAIPSSPLADESRLKDPSMLLAEFSRIFELGVTEPNEPRTSKDDAVDAALVKSIAEFDDREAAA